MTIITDMADFQRCAICGLALSRYDSVLYILQPYGNGVYVEQMHQDCWRARMEQARKEGTKDDNHAAGVPA